MEKIQPDHKKCFKIVKNYVRKELKIEKFVITNHKIIRYCWEYNNDPNKVKIEVKKHIEEMNNINLRKLEKLPKAKCQLCKYI